MVASSPPPAPAPPSPRPQRRLSYYQGDYLRRVLLKFSTPTVFSREGEWGKADEVLGSGLPSSKNYSTVLPGYFELQAYVFESPVRARGCCAERGILGTAVTAGVPGAGMPRRRTGDGALVRLTCPPLPPWSSLRMQYLERMEANDDSW